MLAVQKCKTEMEARRAQMDKEMQARRAQFDKGCNKL